MTLYLKHFESFECPACKRKFNVEFAWNSDDVYVCASQCPECGHEFQGVDTLERCALCKSRIECVIRGIVVAHTFTCQPIPRGMNVI